MRKIDNILTLTAGVKAQTVRVNGLAFLLQNNSGTADVYFKEKREDGVDVTQANGWRLGAGVCTTVPLTARELSVIAGAEKTDVRVMIIDED